MKIINAFSRPKVIVLFICIILFILPFFWFTPSELELGGDSSRLYLFDPHSYLSVNNLYSVEPSGFGEAGPHQDYIPFLLFLDLLYLIFKSPYILICLLNSIKLVGAFLFMYLIFMELFKNHMSEKRIYVAQAAAIIGSIFYTFSPSVGKNMQIALISHNLVFLNPMIVYLLLRFLITQRNVYLWFALLITLLFSPNFSVISGMIAVSSFYPLVLLFLVLYVTVCLKKSIPWKKISLGIIVFLGIHAFQIIPGIMYVFDPGSVYNTRVFNAVSIQQEGINYFNAILHNAMVTRSFFYSYGLPHAQWALFVAPLVVILGFFLGGRRHKDFYLIALFFFITTFLFSANITEIGVNFYRMLFYIPGFTMFRNFSGQWQWTQAFFYSLLFGYALFLLFSKLKKGIVYFVSIVIVVLLIFSCWTFVSGQIFREPHRATKNVSKIIEMEPSYEKALSFFKNNPIDGKVFDFPFTEFAYQVVPGLNRGAYIGASPVSHLAGKKDFAGHQKLYPFSDVFLKLIQEKNYDAIKRLFGILNIRYIFHMKDPKAYEAFFPEIPFTLLLEIVPNSVSLNDFVKNVVGEKVFQKGEYVIYYSDNDYYLPHFYVPTFVAAYGKKDDWMGQNTSFYIHTKALDPRIGYIEKEVCQRFYTKSDCNPDRIYPMKESAPIINFQRINPTKYRIQVSDAKAPFILVFLDQFHKDWKVFISDKKEEKREVQRTYFDGAIEESFHQNVFLNKKTFETIGMKSVPEKQHFKINGYANAWYITPKESGGKNSYEITVEMTQQRLFYVSLAISLLSLVVFIIWGIRLFLQRKK